MSLPNAKKKFKVHLKQNEDDEFHIVSAHYIRVAGTVQYIHVHMPLAVETVCGDELIIVLKQVGDINLMHTGQVVHIPC